MDFWNLFKRPSIQEGLTRWEKMPGALLLDVRTRQEYAQGHLPGSQNIPVDELERVAAIAPNRETPLFVYCLSGSRSGRAVRGLRRMGYKSVTNIGGISGYQGKLEV